MSFRRRHPMGKPPKDPRAYVPLRRIYDLVSGFYRGGQVSSRTVPLTSTLKPGTWLVDADFNGIHGHGIEEVVLIDPRKLTPTEFRWEDPEAELRQGGRLADAMRYVEWLKTGKTPLPVTVVEADNGELRVTDGHRRLFAHAKLGRKVPARISWSAPHPERLKDSRGRPMRTGLTYEMATGRPFVTGNPMKGVPGGSVSACITRMSLDPNVDDPGALCASIARKRGELIPRRKPRKMSAGASSRSKARTNPMAEEKYPGTERQYFSSLRSTAREIVKQARKDSDTDDEYRDRLSEAVSTASDNAVTYYHNVRRILTFTENIDAIEETMGEVQGGDAVFPVLTRIAYWAYYQDLQDMIGVVETHGNPRKKGAKKTAKKTAKRSAKKTPKRPKAKRGTLKKKVRW